MNKLPIEKRSQIIELICEGNSLRSTSRISKCSINTVSKLLQSVGMACLRFHSQTIVQVRSNYVHVDEQWAFIHTKEKNVKEDKFGVGSVWNWVALDSETKLVISWYAGRRDQQSANFFMNDLWCRLRTRVQLSSDGYSAYIEAVANTFGSRIDYGQLVKQYSTESTTLEGKKDKRERYIGADRRTIIGNPDKSKISTSHLERFNLTSRMTNRRLARQTNAFSKKYDYHCYAIALNFTFYNFVRIHKSLRVTPAMEAKFAKRPLTYIDLANLAEGIIPLLK